MNRPGFDPLPSERTFEIVVDQVAYAVTIDDRAGKRWTQTTGKPLLQMAEDAVRIDQALEAAGDVYGIIEEDDVADADQPDFWLANADLVPLRANSSDTRQLEVRVPVL